MRWLPCLLPLLALRATAAEIPMPEVPDPLGLGPRLALIEELRQEGAKVPEGSDLEQLKALYWSRHGGVPGQAADNELGTVDEEALARDRIRRLREELARRHVPAPENADEDQLAALLRDARERERADAQVAGARAADADRHGGAAKADAGDADATAADVAADAKSLQLDAWKRRVAAAMAKLDPRPLDSPPIFPWGERPLPSGGGKGTVRVIHDDGREELLEELPANDHGLASLWKLHELAVQRTLTDGTGTHQEAYEWMPLFFVAGAGWVQDPDAKRRELESDVFGEWFANLLSGPDGGGIAPEGLRRAEERVAAIQNQLIHARIPAEVGDLEDAEREKHRAEAAELEQTKSAALADLEREITTRAAALGLPPAPIIAAERACLRIREQQELAEHRAIEAQLARDEAKRQPDAAHQGRAADLMRDWESRMAEIVELMKQRRAAMTAATPAP